MNWFILGAVVSIGTASPAFAAALSITKSTPHNLSPDIGSSRYSGTGAAKSIHIMRVRDGVKKGKGKGSVPQIRIFSWMGCR
jgi:hypothetical protein